MKKKFNIVDWVVIGLVVVVAGFFGIRWFQNSQVEISYGEITYTVLVEAVPEESCADIDRHLPDQLMSSGALVGGEVVSVEYSDCSVQSIEKSNSSNDYITVTVDPYGEYKKRRVHDKVEREPRRPHDLRGQSGDKDGQELYNQDGAL